MNNMLHNRQIYSHIARHTSCFVTRQYSTSFSLSIRLLDHHIRGAIYAIYGFVRLGDEIVDTFIDHDRKAILEQFRQETFRALEYRVSMNPLLHNFQETVHKYDIDYDLIEAFFESMAMDLQTKQFERSNYTEYIYGSAEVVGLMCLKVFCKNSPESYQELEIHAKQLGAAFQKVNFLRDISQDTNELNRLYFPHFGNGLIDRAGLSRIVKEIESDFKDALLGIRKLPSNARFGVLLAYEYYQHLLEKLKTLSPESIQTTRIRVSNLMKFFLFLKTAVRFKLNII